MLLPVLLALAYLLEPSLGECLGAPVNATRRKRSLTFPKGSNFLVTMAIVKAIQREQPAPWNLDLEFDMVWPIPNGLEADKRPGRRPAWRRPHRRHRRQLYSNLELALESQGLPGDQCVLRTLCEAKFILNPPGVSLLEDVLRVIFSYPSSGTPRPDPYDAAASTGRRDDCEDSYPCPLSLLHLLLNLAGEEPQDE